MREPPEKPTATHEVAVVHDTSLRVPKSELLAPAPGSAPAGPPAPPTITMLATMRTPSWAPAILRMVFTPSRCRCLTARNGALARPGRAFLSAPSRTGTPPSFGAARLTPGCSALPASLPRRLCHASLGFPWESGREVANSLRRLARVPSLDRVRAPVPASIDHVAAPALWIGQRALWISQREDAGTPLHVLVDAPPSGDDSVAGNGSDLEL